MYTKFQVELRLLRGQHVCACAFLLDCASFIYSSHLIVLIRVLLILIRFVGTETL